MSFTASFIFSPVIFFSSDKITQRNTKGIDLLERVCDHINLVERDYFGLTYLDKENIRVSLLFHTLFSHLSLSLVLLFKQMCVQHPQELCFECIQERNPDETEIITSFLSFSLDQQQSWLNPDKKISKQLKSKYLPFILSFFQ